MFSNLVEAIEEAGSIRINQMVYDKRLRKEDVTVLSLGEAFFDIPMFDFGKLDFEKGYHYSDTRGFPPLRRKLVEYYKTYHEVDADPDRNVLISAGSKICVYMAIQALLNEGDEVLIHEPYWVSYPEQVKLCRGVPKVIPYDVQAKDFEKYFSSRTKLLILNNPNNPAGSVYSRADLEQIYAVCKKHGAYFLVDEAYSDFCLDKNFYSAGRLDKKFENLILVNSLSKNMGMSGWRLGYLMTNPEFLYQILKLNQHLITCAATVLQQYVEKYFDQILEHTLPQARDVVRKRERVAQYMDSIGLEYLDSASTFYFFVNIKKSGRRSGEFAEQLLREHSIAVVPGIAYGEGTDGFVRVSIGTESEERIQNALSRIRKMLA